jgi:hypothetical protein
MWADLHAAIGALHRSDIQATQVVKEKITAFKHEIPDGAPLANDEILENLAATLINDRDNALKATMEPSPIRPVPNTKAPVDSEVVTLRKSAAIDRAVKSLFIASLA